MSEAMGRFDEGSSGTYNVSMLTDEAGAAIPLASVTTLMAKVIDRDTGNTLMADTDVKSGLHATSGAFSMAIPAAATAIVTTTKERESHVLRLALTLTNGKKRNWNRTLMITNLHLVP